MGKYWAEQCHVPDPLLFKTHKLHPAVPYLLPINAGLIKELQSILPNCITMFHCTVYAVGL